jgi:hypothetical protein
MDPASLNEIVATKSKMDGDERAPFALSQRKWVIEAPQKNKKE